MKNLTLANDFLNVNINTLGAELTSLIDKRDGIEHMWNASPKFWPRHAPILFPTVGESRNGQIQVEGKTYGMGRHGFARTEAFEVLESGPHSTVLELRSNQRTKEHYPFEFAFRVGYELNQDTLSQTFEVENVGERPLGFQVGGHPAFAVPFRDGERFDEYCIRFGSPQTLDRHLLTPDGLYSGETRRFMDGTAEFQLYYEVFDEDALVFKDISSKTVWIQHHKGGKRLQVEYPAFPHLGIWSIPGANYVCIEPWIGCADHVDQSPDLFQKDNVIVLDPEAVFKASFTIRVIQED